MTCGSWTRGGEASAMLGRHERIGLGDFDAARSWNSSYYTRGCSLDLQRTTGGAGLSCCFAAR